MSYATQIASFNEIPATNDLSRGFLRRWVIVEFPNNFEGREDPELEEVLRGELPGIFNLAVAALRRLMDDGNFKESSRTKDLLKQYREDSDPVEQFLNERTRVEQGSETPAKDLYTAYKFWSEKNGHAVMSNTRFGSRVKLALGTKVDYKHTNSGKVYVGVKLLPAG
ncbi:primase-like DNA-binding domain-containing protein [Pseudonocardia sp. T1-2H]|uniref:primase-like DNA-binding domain-containing protein n=1 Tax=Pseudonocardia sp. T1-2H TaxID=3128899 RepID=UPI00310186C1